MPSEVNADYIMPFGKYKGLKLSEVSNGYLEKLYRTNKAGKLKQYIEENVPIIRWEKEQKNKQKDL